LSLILRSDSISPNSDANFVRLFDSEMETEEN